MWGKPVRAAHVEPDSEAQITSHGVESCVQSEIAPITRCRVIEIAHSLNINVIIFRILP